MKRSAIIVALALPGAICVGLYGFLIVAFAGDADPTAFAFFCWCVWAVVGGACIGALPGLLVGLFLKVRWVIPLLGAAIGGFYGLVEASGVHLAHGVWQLAGGSADVRHIDMGGYASGVAVVSGFLIGIMWYRSLINRPVPL